MILSSTQLCSHPTLISVSIYSHELSSYFFHIVVTLCQVLEIYAGSQFIPKSGAILKSFCLLLGIRASAYLYFGTLNNFAVSKKAMKNETLDHSTRQRESR